MLSNYSFINPKLKMWVANKFNCHNPALIWAHGWHQCHLRNLTKIWKLIWWKLLLGQSDDHGRWLDKVTRSLIGSQVRDDWTDGCIWVSLSLCFHLKFFTLCIFGAAFGLFIFSSWLLPHSCHIVFSIQSNNSYCWSLFKYFVNTWFKIKCI